MGKTRERKKGPGRTRQKQVDLTTTSCLTFQRCPREYQYRYEMLLDVPASEPMEIGSIFHEALDLLSNRRDLDAVMPHLHIRWGKCDAFLIAQFLIREYFREYADDPIKVKDSEIIFHVPLTDRFTLSGKIDALARYRKKLWVIERKTTGYIDRRFSERTILDPQLLLYGYAATKMGKKIEGVCFDVVGRPRLYRRKDETIDTWLRRCESDYAVNSDTYFLREFVPLDERRHESLLETLHWVYNQIIGCRKAAVWPQNFASCWFKSGAYARPCPFLELCTNGVTAETLMAFETKDTLHPELETQDE